MRGLIRPDPRPRNVMKKRNVLALFAAALLAGPVALAALGDGAQDKAEKAEKADPAVDEAAIIAVQLPSYPLTTCPISGKEIEGAEDAKDIVHEGRLVRLCCGMCKKGFAKDPAKYIAMVDAAVVKAQLATYPLETCPISGEKLGGMGEPIDYVYGTRLVRFCCKGCPKDFKKDPAKTMAVVDAALIKAQLAAYPLDTCPVSGEELGGEMGEPIDYLYGTRLVRFCCKSCVKKFKREPAETLAMLDTAAKAK